MELIVQRGKPKEYYKDVKGYFSISQIRKEMLPQWYPDDESARRRGNRLHTRFAVALGAKAGLCAYPDVIPEYTGYCRAMDAWVFGAAFKPVKIEEPSVCEKYGFAGTPENLLDFAPGVLGIVDLKTGGETKTDGIQLILNTMLEGYEDATRLLNLYIAADGTHRTVERKFDPFGVAAALSAINVLTWRLTL